MGTYKTRLEEQEAHQCGCVIAAVVAAIVVVLLLVLFLSAVSGRDFSPDCWGNY